MMTRAIVLAGILGVLFPISGTSELRAQESGVEMWGRTCTRCHNARPVNERTDREWTTIVKHMRARANLTRSEARTILEFLRAANAPEAGAVSQAPMRPSESGERTASEADPVSEYAATRDAARPETGDAHREPAMVPGEGLQP